MNQIKKWMKIILHPFFYLMGLWYQSVCSITFISKLPKRMISSFSLCNGAKTHEAWKPLLNTNHFVILFSSRYRPQYRRFRLEFHFAEDNASNHYTWQRYQVHLRPSDVPLIQKESADSHQGEWPVFPFS